MLKIQGLKAIASRYDGILFDAFGVLLDEKGALPGAASLIKTLHDTRIPFWVLTNGSSKLENKLAEKYQDFGLEITSQQIITSGSLLARKSAELDLKNAKVGVLGTPDSIEYAKRAGSVPIEPLSNEGFDALIIANQTEYPLLECLDWALTSTIRKIDAGLKVQVIVTNPDLFYPKGAGEYGITAGSLGLIIEQSLMVRFGSKAESFIVKLGKPFSPIFEAAVDVASSKNLLMVGDQIHTDIAGANAFGLDSLLLTTGLTPESVIHQIPQSLKPTFVASSLQWDTN